MVQKSKVALGALLLAGCGFAWSAGETPLESYQGAVAYGRLTCQITFKLQQEQQTSIELGLGSPEKPADFRACIQEQKGVASARLKRAMASLKKANARSALKELHVTYIGALEGIAPGIDETKLSYSTRQAALDDKIRAAETRLEVEQ